MDEPAPGDRLDQTLALLLMGALAVISFVVAWRRDETWLTVRWTWTGWVIIAALSMGITRWMTGHPPEDAPATIMKIVLIGWFPGLIIQGVASFIRHFFFWDGK